MYSVSVITKENTEDLISLWFALPPSLSFLRSYSLTPSWPIINSQLPTPRHCWATLCSPAHNTILYPLKPSLSLQHIQEPSQAKEAASSSQDRHVMLLFKRRSRTVHQSSTYHQSWLFFFASPFFLLNSVYCRTGVFGYPEKSANRVECLSKKWLKETGRPTQGVSRWKATRVFG